MKTLLLFCSLLFTISCQSSEPEKEPSSGSGSDTASGDVGDGLIDADGDGVIAEMDCDDSDASVHPGAPELCNDFDDDCDGEVDENPSDGVLFYYDGDGDGYGIDGASVESCSAPEGYVEAGGDCDDSEPAIHPDAPEEDCTDPVDYNCDGSVGYADADGDGSPACEDCNDANENVHPGMPEICNDGVDDNCDGSADEAGSEGESLWYADADGDLHGDPDARVSACDAPEGYVDNDLDCNDASSLAHPSAVEICDGLDNDCDGTVDGPGAIGGLTLYADADGDGHGVESETMAGCEGMEGYASTFGDCDDTTAAVHPGAEEICDGLDNDCSGGVDEGLLITVYADPDGDGYGLTAVSMDVCDVPEGYVTESGDCDEGDALINPAAEEVCDGADNDCSGGVDEGLLTTVYGDPDGDGFGSALMLTEACGVTDGYAAEAGDCDEGDALINPAAEEVCDGVDNDCSGGVDEGLLTTVYGDPDGDGFGSALMPTEACGVTDGFAAEAGDCDEGDALINPAAEEVCDGVDNDCSGGVDEGLLTTVYADPDGDGYGLTAVSMGACGVPDGYATEPGDCDEGDALVNPAAEEVCDGADNDCSGGVDEGLLTTVYADPDGDGYGLALMPTEACGVSDGYAAVSGDCDETNALINPAAEEVCDEVDNDCSGGVDEGLTAVFYADADADGFGSESDTIEACSVPFGYVDNATDCEPDNAAVNPDATEVCDAIDNNCNGDVDDDDSGLDLSSASSFYADLDLDGYGAGDAFTQCVEPSGSDSYVLDNTDCLDSDGDSYPGATEVWYDGIDQDCGGDSDYDADGDGFDSVDYGGSDTDDTDEACVTACLLGLSEDAAASSCEEILEDDPFAENGDYWIDMDGTPFQTYCDMDEGGWTSCFELVNTTDEDLVGNTWFDRCVDWTMSADTGNDFRLTVQNASGTLLYDARGVRPGTWTYNNLTTSQGAGDQYYSYNHSLISMDNGDKLFISGRFGTQSGCGGSLGNGYVIVAYGPSGEYVSELRLLVSPYYQISGYTGIRGFDPWSESHELSYSSSGATFGSCGGTPDMLGTFRFMVR